MVSTPDGCTNKILMTLNPYVSNKNPIARKTLNKFSKTLDVKHKTSICRTGKSREKYKEIKTGNVLWSNIENSLGHTKINQKVRKYLYHWIMNHPKVVQYLIENCCIYVSIDGNSKRQLISKLLL